MSKNQVIAGHVMIILSQIVLGINIPVTRDLLVNFLSPLGYMAVRATAAAVFFWVVQSFAVREKINRRDFLLIIAGGFLGFVFSQFLTALSLRFTTPVYFALILALSPIFVMAIESVCFKQRISRRKLLGVIIGILGALILAIRAAFEQGPEGSNNLLGLALAVVSVCSFAAYVVICGDISRRYKAVTQMKWVFAVSMLFTLPPLGLGGLWRSEPILSSPDYLIGLAEIAFLIVFCTIGTYTLIPMGMRTVSSEVVAIYMNLQPVTASVTAIVVGMDIFSWDKPLALILVLTGAWIVNSSHQRVRQVE